MVMPMLIANDNKDDGVDVDGHGELGEHDASDDGDDKGELSARHDHDDNTHGPKLDLEDDR